MKNNLNLLPALAILGVVAVLVAVGGYYAFSVQDDTIQGQAEVDEFRVSSKVPGRILRLYVHEGDTVHAGDTLAVLEAPDVEAKLEQARAAEAAAEAHNRVKRLYDEGVMTAQKLDEVTAQLNAAIATEKAAKAQYDMAVNGAQREDRDAAQAMVNRAKGAVNEVSSYIDETVLIAPRDGEVTEIFPEEGELVGTGAPIMHLARMQEAFVTFNVREDKLAGLKMHQTVKAIVPALGNQEITLRIYYMKDLGSYAAWKATKTTGDFDRRTFEVKARPEQPVPGLRPGMSVLLKQ